MQTTPQPKTESTLEKIENEADASISDTKVVKEIGGAKGPEPTRYGDWEHKGRCTDF